MAENTEQISFAHHLIVMTAAGTMHSRVLFLSHSRQQQSALLFFLPYREETAVQVFGLDEAR